MEKEINASELHDLLQHHQEMEVREGMLENSEEAYYHFCKWNQINEQLRMLAAVE